MVRGLGGCYLYEIALWLHAGSLLRHGFRNRLKWMEITLIGLDALVVETPIRGVSRPTILFFFPCSPI
jgi:hypothetical protein